MDLGPALWDNVGSAMLRGPAKHIMCRSCKLLKIQMVAAMISRSITDSNFGQKNKVFRSEVDLVLFTCWGGLRWEGGAGRTAAQGPGAGPCNVCVVSDLGTFLYTRSMYQVSSD